MASVGRKLVMGRARQDPMAVEGGKTLGASSIRSGEILDEIRAAAGVLGTPRCLVWQRDTGGTVHHDTQTPVRWLHRT